MDVRFPVLSRNDSELDGVVATWFVSEGQVVQKDQLIAEVQVEKVSAEVVAPISGQITFLANEQEVVHQGSAIARID